MKRNMAIHNMYGVNVCQRPNAHTCQGWKRFLCVSFSVSRFLVCSVLLSIAHCIINVSALSVCVCMFMWLSYMPWHQQALFHCYPQFEQNGSCCAELIERENESINSHAIIRDYEIIYLYNMKMKIEKHLQTDSHANKIQLLQILSDILKMLPQSLANDNAEVHPWVSIPISPLKWNQI